MYLNLAYRSNYLCSVTLLGSGGQRQFIAALNDNDAMVLLILLTVQDCKQAAPEEESIRRLYIIYMNCYLSNITFKKHCNISKRNSQTILETMEIPCNDIIRSK